MVHFRSNLIFHPNLYLFIDNEPEIKHFPEKKGGLATIPFDMP